tara:strand:+ start:168 stop:446 length:279 start_codon:yes stop_codon:yes gene_type:complete
MKTYQIQRGKWYTDLGDERTQGVFLIEEDISKALAIDPQGSKTTAEFSEEEKLWVVRNWELEDDCWVCVSAFTLSESAVAELYDYNNALHHE